jgi:hypothetical protein
MAVGNTFSDNQIRMFLRTIERMPPQLMQKIAEENDVDLPFELSSPSELSEFLLKELSDDVKENIINTYGDAGSVLSYFFTSGDNIPILKQLKEKSIGIYSLKEQSETLEDVPYFDQVEIHKATQTLRVRFHYYKGKTYLLDEETKTIKEFRRAFYGVVIYRPEKKLLEVRTKHLDLARKAAQRTASALGIEDLPVCLDFRKQDYIKRFLDWIRSLNNARIEFPIREAKSSLIISARSGIDLRKLKEFQTYLEHGMLRGGHATIEKEKGKQINFRIFFRDCRTFFTSFCTEDDIQFVVDAIEKITEGFKFAVPDKMLEQFFK